MQDTHLVVPGQVIAVSESEKDAFLRGHGTYVEQQQNNDQTRTVLRAAVLGQVRRVNKLIHVQGLSSKQHLHTGNVVIGRVIEIGNARWMVDIFGNNNKSAVLPLSNLHIPHVQRIRTATDALSMRQLLDVNDLVSAEIQTQKNHLILLHTRTERYGKLPKNGLLVVVPSYLIPPTATHFFMIHTHYQVLLAVNGWIWIQKYDNNNNKKEEDEQQQQPQDACGQQPSNSNHDDNNNNNTLPLSNAERHHLVRIKQSILVLKHSYLEITQSNIQAVLERSDSISTRDMLEPCHLLSLSAAVRQGR